MSYKAVIFFEFGFDQVDKDVPRSMVAVALTESVERDAPSVFCYDADPQKELSRQGKSRLPPSVDFGN
jgi:hypothetical protein